VTEPEPTAEAEAEGEAGAAAGEAAGEAEPAGGSVGAWRVLRAPQAARVLGASLIGRLPLGATPLAMLIFARGRLSIAGAAFLVAAYTAGVALGGPALARAADRWRQPPVLWLAAAGSTLGYLIVVTGRSWWLEVVGAALAGLGAPPFEACLRVLWRDLLPPRAVSSAYTVDIAAQELIFVLGPLVAAGAVGLAGAPGGLVTAGLAQLLGTAWFATTPAVRRWRGEPAHRHWLGPLRSAALRVILAAVLLVGLAVGSVVVAATGYAEARGTTASAGLLLAAQAAGALIGGLAYTRRRPARSWRLSWIAAAMTVSYLPLVATPTPAAMLALLVFSGLGLPVLLTTGFLTVDEVAPVGTAAEAFAWVATAFAVGSAIGSAVTGLVLDAAGSVRAGFLVAPVALAAAGLVLVRLNRKPAE
jgi:predicted MFS family arabinose efflux permease